MSNGKTQVLVAHFLFGPGGSSGLERLVCATITESEIIPGITPGSPDIFPEISQEGQHHIENDGGAHGQQGCINKILADPAGSNSHPRADGRTNAKGIPLDKAFEFVHHTKLKNCGKSPNTPQA